MGVNREQITLWLKTLQDQICAGLEEADELATFKEENWSREEGGGGRTRVIQNGAVLEKGGVNFSAVFGDAPEFLFREKEHSQISGVNKTGAPQFFATGISIVLHPGNPFVPIIHMNLRYFELEGASFWLGGGIDLSPVYINRDDAGFFHKELKAVCDKHHPAYYHRFKEWADDYFFIRHRKETRGIGGIFFDRLNQSDEMDFEQNLLFWKDIGNRFLPIYRELIRRNKNRSFNSQNLDWQRMRRGRYVEFNLVYDKGTRFGLETNGRIESILMSLPKTAGWEYHFVPAPGSEEEHTQSLLKKGINWLSP